MILEESDVGLRLVARREELFLRRDVHRSRSRLGLWEWEQPSAEKAVDTKTTQAPVDPLSTRHRGVARCRMVMIDILYPRDFSRECRGGRSGSTGMVLSPGRARRSGMRRKGERETAANANENVVVVGPADASGDSELCSNGGGCSTRTASNRRGCPCPPAAPMESSTSSDKERGACMYAGGP